MSEAATFAAYAEHERTCNTCRVKAGGMLCAEGAALHEAWQREAAAQPRKAINDAVARALGHDPFTGTKPKRRRAT